MASQHNASACLYMICLEQHRNYLLQKQEFESLSQKGPVIESGINTLNSLLTLRLNFNTALHVPNVVNVQNGNYEACYLKVFCLYDTFLSITPGTGIMRTET